MSQQKSNNLLQIETSNDVNNIIVNGDLPNIRGSNRFN